MSKSSFLTAKISILMPGLAPGSSFLFSFYFLILRKHMQCTNQRVVHGCSFPIGGRINLTKKRVSLYGRRHTYMSQYTYIVFASWLCKCIYRSRTFRVMVTGRHKQIRKMLKESKKRKENNSFHKNDLHQA